MTAPVCVSVIVIWDAVHACGEDVLAVVPAMVVLITAESSRGVVPGSLLVVAHAVSSSTQTAAGIADKPWFMPSSEALGFRSCDAARAPLVACAWIDVLKSDRLGHDEPGERVGGADGQSRRQNAARSSLPTRVAGEWDDAGA
jgi:hypothetical protein